MKNRQIQIIHFLLKKKKNVFTTINEIAKTIKCSEKTIRNDFKQIDLWLKKDFQAKIIRKPNTGVRIEVSEEEKKRILSLGQKAGSGRFYDEERKEKMILMLLDNKILSLHDLSEKFYVSRQVIKQDLKEIEAWLEAFALSIESRQKVGMKLIGEEKNKRAALLRVNQFGKRDELTEFYKKRFSNYEITKAKQQFKKIEKELNKEFTEETLNDLVFHLLVTIKRVKGKQNINMSKQEVEGLKAKKEYEIVKTNIKELEGSFVLKFPEEEIAYILLHVLGSKEKGNVALKASDLSPEIHSFLVNLIKKTSEHTNVPHEQDEQLFHGLALHMQTTFKRIEHGLYHKNPLLNDIKKTYPYTFDTLFHVVKELRERVGFGFPEDEIGYLTLHFEASKERLQKNDGKNKRVVVVCSMGIGMSQLLTTRLERTFHSFEIIRCISVEELDDVVMKENPDFIISTIPLKETRLPVVTVSPLFQKNEEEKIKTFISHLGTIGGSQFVTLKKFIHKELILFKEEIKEPDEIIQSLGGLLEKKGYINKEYVRDSIEREKLSSTAIGGEIAIPHGHPKNVLKQGIALALLKEPVLWKHQFVSVVFMLSIKETKDEDIKRLFEEISLLGEEPEILERWKKEKTKHDFYENILSN